MDRETKVKNIVNILWEIEHNLSDGYGYYCRGTPQQTTIKADEIVGEYLIDVANRILTVIKGE